MRISNRAVADQLTFNGVGTEDHKSLREIAARYIQTHAEEFCPFLGLEPTDPAFEAYCDKVASETQAEWGGQLEVTALAAALQMPIHVYSADAPILVTNGFTAAESTTAVPLKITYHRHYFALGEHYNSVTSAEEISTKLEDLAIFE